MKPHMKKRDVIIENELRLLGWLLEPAALELGAEPIAIRIELEISKAG
jgi:hypothetical protein